MSLNGLDWPLNAHSCLPHTELLSLGLPDVAHARKKMKTMEAQSPFPKTRFKGLRALRPRHSVWVITGHSTARLGYPSQESGRYDFWAAAQRWSPKNHVKSDFVLRPKNKRILESCRSHYPQDPYANAVFSPATLGAKAWYRPKRLIILLAQIRSQAMCSE